MTWKPDPTYTLPGWYPDPEHAYTLRYWNGAQWTDERATPTAPQQAPVMTPDQVMLRKRQAHRVKMALFVVMMAWLVAIVINMAGPGPIIPVVLTLAVLAAMTVGLVRHGSKK